MPFAFDDRGAEFLRVLRLTEGVRMRVKHPLGSLIVGSPDKTMEILKASVEREKPSKLIAIGDSVASNMMKYGVKADLYVIDNKIMRKPVDTIATRDLNILRAHNPPGMIIEEAWEATKKSVEDPSISCIIVDGEEDLLALPAIKFAPEGAMVVYGQPHVGIVIVRVTERKRKEIEALIEAMEIVAED